MNVSAMLCVDMIGSHCPNSPEMIHPFYYTKNTGALKDIILYHGQELGMTMFPLLHPFGRSDEISYNAIGVPGVHFFQYDFNPHYHSETDLLINVNMDYVTQWARLITAVTMDLSRRPPTPLSFRLAEFGNGHTVRAEWDMIDVYGISFLVNVRNKDTDDEAKHETINNSFLITNLIAGTPYEITVYTVLNDAKSIGISRSITTTSQPKQVVGFQARPSLDKIILSWTSSPEIDIQGYRIYRRIGDSGDFILLETVPVSSNTYVDSNTENNTWYSYKVITYDSEGNTSPDSAILTSRLLAMDGGILVVDLTRNTGGTILNPPKHLVDAFYWFILQSYTFDEVEYQNPDQIRLENIGQYSTLIIHKNSFFPENNDVLLDVLKSFINYGGNVLLTAPDLVQYISRLPYSDEIDKSHLVRDYFKINRVSKSDQARLAQGTSTGWNNIPNLEVNPALANPVFHGKLNNIEVFHGDEFEILYTHFSDSTDENESKHDGLPIAIYVKRGDSHIVLTSIPLYFVNRYQAREFMEIVLNHFEGDVSEDDETVPRLAQSLNLRNFPNPFNPYTTIQFSLSLGEGRGEGLTNVTLEIYNIRGQIVRTLLDGSQEFGTGVHSVVWDGKDDTGNVLGSGIYFYKAQTNAGLQEVRRMVLIK